MAEKNTFVKRIVVEDELVYNGETLLTYKIEYPEINSYCYQGCTNKVNSFYMHQAMEYKNYCETILFDMAVEQYEYCIENGFPIRMYEAVLTYKATYMCSCIVSTFFDRYEYTGGAHGNTVRYSYTWDLRKCSLIKLRHLVLCAPSYKEYLLKEIEAQIEREPDIYFENYKELIDKTFNKESFYCTPWGVVVYYQQYDIAPYSSGIRGFLIPYSNCVRNPQMLCYRI